MRLWGAVELGDGVLGRRDEIFTLESELAVVEDGGFWKVVGCRFSADQVDT